MINSQLSIVLYHAEIDNLLRTTVFPILVSLSSIQADQILFAGARDFGSMISGSLKFLRRGIQEDAMVVREVEHRHTFIGSLPHRDGGKGGGLTTQKISQGRAGGGSQFCASELASREIAAFFKACR